MRTIRSGRNDPWPFAEVEAVFRVLGKAGDEAVAIFIDERRFLRERVRLHGHAEIVLRQHARVEHLYGAVGQLVDPLLRAGVGGRRALGNGQFGRAPVVAVLLPRGGERNAQLRIAAAVGGGQREAQRIAEVAEGNAVAVPVRKRAFGHAGPVSAGEHHVEFAPLQALRQREGRVERHRYRLAVKVDLRGGGGNPRQVFGDIGAAFEADGGAFGHARLRPVRRLLKPDVICVDFLELFQRLFAVARLCARPFIVAGTSMTPRFSTTEAFAPKLQGCRMLLPIPFSMGPLSVGTLPSTPCTRAFW